MNAKQVVLSALLLALLIICSQVTVPLPPVPITLQTFAVLLIGMVLPPRLALLVTGAYAGAGLLGLPIFAKWSGGPNSIISPTFGFVLSFILASWAMATYLQKYPQDSRKLQHYLLAALLGSIIIYAVGLPYLAYVLNVLMGKELGLMAILNIGMLPFLIGDTFKLILAVFVARRVESHNILQTQVKY